MKWTAWQLSSSFCIAGILAVAVWSCLWKAHLVQLFCLWKACLVQWFCLWKVCLVHPHNYDGYIVESWTTIEQISGVIFLAVLIHSSLYPACLAGIDTDSSDIIVNLTHLLQDFSFILVCVFTTWCNTHQIAWSVLWFDWLKWQKVIDPLLL